MTPGEPLLSVRRSRAVLLLASIVLIAGAQIAQSQAKASLIIDRFIAKQADNAEAAEYRDARKVIRGDLNRDGREDMAVLYTLEGFHGGNSYSQYLAVFLNRGKTFRFLTQETIGGKLFRNVEFRSISQGRINFDIREYRAKDAACCPSRKGRITAVLSGRKLKIV
jgi:hypothetical protein